MKIIFQCSTFRVVSIIFTFFFVIPYKPVFGGILNVPNDYQTIQGAIDAATDGDTVVVEDGTYTGSGNKNILFYGKAITVESANGPQNCRIDCESSGRGFNFINEESANSILSGFTITNGYVSTSDVGFTGGGINIHYKSSPTIMNCIIAGNQAELSGGGINISWESFPSISNCIINNNIAKTSGGGIEIDLDSSPTITDCIIDGNLAIEDGAGINCGNSTTPEIKNCTIASNYTYSGSGGGIYAYAASPTIADCTINMNQAKKGGGLYFYSCPVPPALSNCSVTGNLALSGGGLYWQYTSPTINNCRINGNQVISSSSSTLLDSGFGGGILCGVPDYSNNASITNSIISDNIASKSGGGIYALSIDGCANSVFLTNCVIAQNSAHQGGGVFIEKGVGCDISFTLTNCTINKNKADDGGGIFFDNTSSNSNIKNTIVWGNTIGQINLSNLNVTYSDIEEGYTGLGNIDFQPEFVCTPKKNYRLRATSPCIDAGSNSDAPDIDIEGNLRPQGENVDIGAYEGEFTGSCGIPPSILHMLLDD